MLFVQPVVVNDVVAAERAAPAEVRIADRDGRDAPTWTGTLLAQSSIDQRSPFGANAPNANDGTPDFVPPGRPATTPAGTGTPGTTPGDSASTTRIPPPSARPDAGPPPPAARTSAPGTAPAGTGTPGGTLGETPNASRSSAAPSTPSNMPVRNPTGLEPGATIPGTSTPAPLPVPAPAPAQPSTTLPGVSSGASNTQ